VESVPPGLGLRRLKKGVIDSSMSPPSRIWQRLLDVDGRVIKLARRKHAYRWYEGLPGLIPFIHSLPKDEGVRVVAQRGNPI
jgi:hypothetical protein